jgi:hypothetical protein
MKNDEQRNEQANDKIGFFGIRFVRRKRLLKLEVTSRNRCHSVLIQIIGGKKLERI